MWPTHDARTRWLFAAVAAVAFCTLLGLEIATEEDGITPAELTLEVLELLLTIAAAAGVALLIGSWRRQHEEKIALLRDLDAARREGESWRQRVQTHLNGLGMEIRRQLERWRLTEAECEVALLVLKGFSHKEIATLRGTSEATARQQARAAYEKSGLHGRAPFCAFFLEDLLPAGDMNLTAGAAGSGANGDADANGAPQPVVAASARSSSN